MPETDARTYWNERHAARPEIQEPSAFVVGARSLIAASGTALDVAGGTGRHAIWLAGMGLTTTLADVSEVALDLARAVAAGRGLAIEVIQRDIETDGLPEGSWDVIVITYFLDRRVLAALPDALNAGGVAIVAHPTRTNLERYPRPPERHLLEDGELATITAGWSGMEIVSLEEGWMPEGRHEARLLARRAD